MPLPTNAQADGVSVITKGMNSGVAPRLVPQGQLAFGINITNRGGMPRTRPVMRKVGLSYVDRDGDAAGTAQARATQALFQGASFYQAIETNESCIVASVGGRLFRYLVASNHSVQELLWDGELNDPYNPNAWMWQAEDFLIVQNGQANPLFFDGAQVRRSLGQAGEELPPGCMGAYVQGRVWQSQPNRNGFIAGDLVYSHGFSGGYNGRDAVLKTEENTFLSGGGAFAVPVQAGSITAMSNIAIADTSLGQGPLQVTTQTSVFSVQVPVNREEWTLTQYPLMTVGLPNYGAVGAWAIATVNGDLWYRSIDGLRSYQVARRDFNTWVNTPLSVEVEAILNKDDDRLLDKASVVLFDNRILATVSPATARSRGTYHRGLVALDFNNISNLTSRSAPCYDGLWTGIPILQLVKGIVRGQERCWAFALDCAGNICLYEILADGIGRFDWDGSQDVGVESSFLSRAMGWADNGNKLKKLLAADLYLDKLAGPGDGTIEFAFRYVSDEDPTLNPWHAFEVCAPSKDCTTADCPTFTPVRDQYRTYVRLPDPPDSTSPITRRYLRTAYEFQVHAWWKGYVQWNRMHVWSQPMPDSVITACPGSEECTLLKVCEENWFSYSIEGCNAEPSGIQGIIWEGPQEGTGGVPPFIGSEDPTTILRTEGQTPVGPVAPPPPPATDIPGEGTPVTPDGPGVPVTPPNDPGEPSPVPVPEWPIPPDYGCSGEATTGVISVYDPIRNESDFVGIPGVDDPMAYVLANGATRCLSAWVTAVWADFIALGIPYSQARVEWVWAPSTQLDFLATEVFPDQPGNYTKTPGPWKLQVRYCPE